MDSYSNENTPQVKPFSDTPLKCGSVQHREVDVLPREVKLDKVAHKSIGGELGWKCMASAVAPLLERERRTMRY